MDYITLAQRLRAECGVSGTNSTVAGATGEWGRLCTWIAQAWEDIQVDNPDWEWMRGTVSLNTTANVGEYAPVADFGLSDFASWRENSFRIYLTAAGVGSEWLLPFRNYNDFRDYYLLSSRKTTYARPTEMTIAPNKNIILGLAPNDVYTVSGEYYKTPQSLTVDADEPTLPARYHMAIVYKAMYHYGMFESAPEVVQRADKEYRRIMSKVRMDQAPRITLGGSLI